MGQGSQYSHAVDNKPDVTRSPRAMERPEGRGNAPLFLFITLTTRCIVGDLYFVDHRPDIARRESREQLISALIHLAVGCPVDQSNPASCPLYEARKKEMPERMQLMHEWIHSLTDEELEYLAKYHQVCLQWRTCKLASEADAGSC